jgi:hypothetical protein
MKGTILHLLALMLLLAAPAAAQDQFDYTTNADNTLTITGYYGPGGAVTIPTTNAAGLMVTSIGDEAFMGYYTLDSVTIPGCVASIGYKAFYDCTALNSITIVNGVTSIDSLAFATTDVTSVYIPASVTNIGNIPFWYCDYLAAINVDPQNAFYSDTDGVLFNKSQTTLVEYPDGLETNYVIPIGVVTVETNAFACAILTSIYIPGSVTNVEESTFAGCFYLTNAVMAQGVTHIGSRAFSGCLSMASVTIPTGLLSIGDGAFASCGLTSVAIPDSVTNLGEGTFDFCLGLTNAILGNGITEIGAGDFSFTGLADIIIPSGVISVESNAFSDTGNMTTVTIPDSVTIIGTGAFIQSGLTQVIIPAGVTNLGDGAFSYCSGLTNITIPVNVTCIGANEFADCTSLTNATIADGVASIGTYAFAETALLNIYIPASVTNIGNNAFWLCANLTAIKVDAQNAFYSSFDGVLLDKSESTLIEYPGGLGGGYTIPFGITSIDGNAFNYCTSVTEINLPATVTNIGEYAFTFCTSLTNLFFEGNAPAIDWTAFANDNFETAYYLPGSTGWAAFSSLTDVPSVLWNPLIQTSDGNFGVRSNQFGFKITGITNIPIVVEACTNLASPVWTPLQTLTLTNGSFYFSDLQWTNYPARYYRIGSP